jgi:hypothetical protein
LQRAPRWNLFSCTNTADHVDASAASFTYSSFPQCDNFVEQYLPLAIQWILNNEPAQTFCTQLGLCTSKRLSLIRVLPKPAQPIPVPRDGSLCGICSLTIASVEQWLQQNSSVSEVEQYLENVCALFPASISALVRAPSFSRALF